MHTPDPLAAGGPPGHPPPVLATPLLGGKPGLLPLGGTIRPGIKILTREAEQQPAARAIYERGMARGASFEQIEAELHQALPTLKHPLRPANVPYFHVRRADFPTPELADLLLERYGEDRGDGVRRLYRFPVIFAADGWEWVMPHQLRCWAAGKLAYWAEYERDGTRRCRCHAPVPRDASSGRAVRLFGGRKVIDRPERGGRCEPEACPQYQLRQCNLDARLLFIVPGVPTLNPIALPTRSYYSMDGIRRQLEHVARLRGGRISGYLLGQQTFWLSKVQRDVARIDDQGEVVKGQAWLIELQAHIDLGSLLLAQGDAAREAGAQQAVQALQGPVVAPAMAVVASAAAAPVGVEAGPQREGGAACDEQHADALAQQRVLVRQLRAEIADALHGAGIDMAAYKRHAAATWGSEDWGRSLPTLQQARAQLREIVAPRAKLQALLVGAGIELERYGAYAERRFRREDWDLHLPTLQRALAEVEQLAQQPDVFEQQLAAELEPE